MNRGNGVTRTLTEKRPIMKPNILFILTDQQHFRMMSCAGNPDLNTPAMDSLAASGVRFDRAYCTNAVCVASRFSLMTGHMPSAIGLFSNNVADANEIPEAIKRNGLGHLMTAAGYETAYGGKVHLPKMSAQDVGFNTICRDERDKLADACSAFIGKKHDKPFLLVASFINPHDICYMGIRDFAMNESEKGILRNGTVECATLDKALARPDGVDEDEFFTQYCPSLPPNFEPQKGEPDALRMMLEKRPFRMNARRQWNEKRWREHRWAYARLTEMVDKQIAQVLDALEQSGKAENTVIVFTSDHGDMDAAHRMEHKSTFYDEACRIPLIIRAPKGMKGIVNNTHLVSNGLDLLPTFCDWAGIPVPSVMEGRSLRGLVENNAPTSWRQAVPVESAIGQAVITEKFKYCRYDIGTHREQLINLESDPWEQVNAINAPGTSTDTGPLVQIFEKVFAGRRLRKADSLLEATHA